MTKAEKALEVFEHNWTNIVNPDYTAAELTEAHSMAIKALNQEWVPIENELPKVGERVLVTAYGRVCYAMLQSVDGNSGYPVFRLQDSLKERVVCETTAHSEFTKGRITAWQRLPEPYKPEGSDNG